MSDQVLLVSGSLRGGSTNTALLRTARLAAPPGVTAVLHEGLERLPHFNPDDDQPPLHPEVAALRAAVRAADAILFCTPEYAGALPGTLKNMLEWTIGDDQPGSIYGKRVAWVNVSYAATGAADAHESLRKVLRYAHADVVDEACAVIPVTRRDVADGTISDPAIRDAIVKVLTALLALQREVKRRGHGEDSIYFAAAKNRYIGVVSLASARTGSACAGRSRARSSRKFGTSSGHCALNSMPGCSRLRATRFRLRSMIGLGAGRCVSCRRLMYGRRFRTYRSAELSTRSLQIAQLPCTGDPLCRGQ